MSVLCFVQSCEAKQYFEEFFFNSHLQIDTQLCSVLLIIMLIHILHDFLIKTTPYIRTNRKQPKKIKSVASINY